MKRPVSIVLGSVLLAAASAAASGAPPTDVEFNARVAPVLKMYCIGCHGGAKPKSDFALDTLSPQFSANADAWKGVLDRLTEGSMPPKGKPRPNDAERAAVINWVGGGITTYQAQRMAIDGRSRLRRLNRIEYVNTLRDLLGAEIDIENLPEDGIAGGFDNVDAGLDLSPTLLERYLETADAALDSIFVSGQRPEVRKSHIDMVSLAKKMTRNNRPMPRFGYGTQIRENDVVFQFESSPPKTIHEARAVRPGRYRFRISANAERNGKEMTFLIYAGTFSNAGAPARLIGAFDVTDKPTVVEFAAEMGEREVIRISPFGLPVNGPAPGSKVNYISPGLAVQWVEMKGPIVEAWPPAPASRLLGDVDLARGTVADAQVILQRFARRAFRRPVDVGELKPFLHLVKAQLDDGESFKEALRVGLKGVLCSPDFLYLSATPGKLNDFDLATRLSYFLWSSTPDDTLNEAADKGELGKPDLLRQQVERMLDDPRAHAFTENFTGQWLNLRDLKATVPDKKLYPEFDDLLEMSMPQETHLFFEEILKHDRSVLEFINSDWTMANERLAALYHIPDVTGSVLRKVSLPAGSHRGGVMTQAAVLKVSANGTTTSPVVRGAWVLNRILGTPPPPPPKDVPALEPDIRGAKTIREQLAKHRQIERCAACHVKIDPPGNALENFDVIGGWRDWYRMTPGSGRTQVKIVSAKGRFKGVGKGPDVVAADVLADGRKFDDIDGFKKLLLENPDQFAHCLTEKLLVYGTGHGLEFSDRATVVKIVDEVRASHYGFRTLIQDIVQSATFRSK